MPTPSTGRVVLYHLDGGEVRPAIITSVAEESVNLGLLVEPGDVGKNHGAGLINGHGLMVLEKVKLGTDPYCYSWPEVPSPATSQGILLDALASRVSSLESSCSALAERLSKLEAAHQPFEGEAKSEAPTPPTLDEGAGQAPSSPSPETSATPADSPTVVGTGG